MATQAFRGLWESECCLQNSRSLLRVITCMVDYLDTQRLCSQYGNFRIKCQEIIPGFSGRSRTGTLDKQAGDDENQPDRGGGQDCFADQEMNEEQGDEWRDEDQVGNSGRCLRET